MNRGLPLASSRASRSGSPSHESLPNSPTTLRGNSETSKGKGRATARRRYVTRDRLREIERGLTERKKQILHDVARLQLMSGRQLRRLHYADSASGRRLARQDLARLVELRLLARLGRRVGGVRSGSEGFVYGLDVAGQRLVYPDRRRYRAPWTPEPSFLGHALAVSELAVELDELVRGKGVELVVFDSEPRSWRRFSGPGGQRLILKPDAFVVCATPEYEDRYFIEVDRATESLNRITDKGRLYGRYWQSGQEQTSHGVYPRVVWIAPGEQRRGQLVEALGRVDAGYWALFTTTTTDQAARVIAGLAEPEVTP